MPEKQRPQPHGPLAELARRQYGVVSIRQLMALGYSRDAVSEATAAGWLHRLHRGVYAVGHRRIGDHGRCLAAVLHCAPGALLSHAAAAWLWGLYRYPPGRIDVTAPTRRHSKAEIAVHHAKLAGADRALRDRIPVTSVARTLLDQAAAVSEERVERLLERAEELELFDLRAADELLGGREGTGGSGGCAGRSPYIERTRPSSARGRRSGSWTWFAARDCRRRPRTSTSPVSSWTPTGSGSGSRSRSTPSRRTGRAAPSSGTGCARTTCSCWASRRSASPRCG